MMASHGRPSSCKVVSLHSVSGFHLWSPYQIVCSHSVPPLFSLSFSCLPFNVITFIFLYLFIFFFLIFSLIFCQTYAPFHAISWPRSFP